MTKISVYVILVLIILVNYGIYCQKWSRRIKYNWFILSNEWTGCSVTCGNGTQHSRIVCVRYSLYNEAIVGHNYCENIPLPKLQIRQCNFGNCHNNRYFWRPSKWSQCSSTCGAAGVMRRDVECFYNEHSSNLTLMDTQKFCNIPNRPQMMQSCNKINCPPHFIPGKWSRCQKSHNCLPGKQRRKLACFSIQSTGSPLQLPRSACYLSRGFNGTRYKATKPPSTWRKCFDFMNIPACQSRNKIKKIPKIGKWLDKGGILVQMRHTRRLQVLIGQTAHILLNTRVLIKCPVTYFVPRDIIWIHANMKYKYHGKVRKHIKVDRRGNLRIRKFKVKDVGKWTCKAGPTMASSVLHNRQRNRGYRDWIIRTTSFDKQLSGLMNDIEVGKRLQYNANPTMELIERWVTGKWSSCSRTCGGRGQQTRSVRCEAVDNQYYLIRSEKDCRGLTKPVGSRTCLKAIKCPEWNFIESPINNNDTLCTNNCIRPGIGLVSGQLRCVFKNTSIDHRLCGGALSVPDSIQCDNPLCQVEWKESDWSRCSRSCGSSGIQGRSLRCIWKEKKTSAGSLCHYQKNLNLPQVVRQCQVPPCNLKCVDLSMKCLKAAKLCHISLYRYICCLTCSKQNSFANTPS